MALLWVLNEQVAAAESTHDFQETSQILGAFSSFSQP